MLTKNRVWRKREFDDRQSTFDERIDASYGMCRAATLFRGGWERDRRYQKETSGKGARRKEKSLVNNSSSEKDSHPPRTVRRR